MTTGGADVSGPDLPGFGGAAGGIHVLDRSSDASREPDWPTVEHAKRFLMDNRDYPSEPVALSHS
jgi:hypothetical protein